MKKLILVAVALIVSPLANAAVLTISCGNETPGFEQCANRANEWAAKTENMVKVISTPNESNETLALYTQLLSSESSDLDVFPVDVVWPGVLANHLLTLDPYIKEEEINQHFPVYLRTNRVNGALKALPWFADVGLLYYRKDLLEKYGASVPETWEELAATSALIQAEERKAGNRRMWGYVFQGRAYEGLTCNVMEWLDSYNGGHVVADSGFINIYNQKAINALNTVQQFVGQISPRGVLNYGEEEARGSFQAGYAVFMRNWPYAWALLNDEKSLIAGKVEVTRLPKGGEDGSHTGTLGGWSMAVSKYTKQPRLAADLAQYITSADSQKQRAIEYSYNPTRMDLYSDADIVLANPFMARLVDTFETAVARPTAITGRHYNRVSSELWNAVHDVLSGKVSARVSLEALEAKLKRISRNGKWR